MRLKKLKIKKKIVFNLKNNRLSSAHFQKLFLILSILLYRVNKKLDRPNELKKVKNRHRGMKFFPHIRNLRCKLLEMKKF